MKRQDPLALAVFGVALALLAGLVLYVLLAKRPAPEPAPRGPSFVEQARKLALDLKARLSPPTAKPSLPQKAQPSATSKPEAGRTWRYAVKVEPEVWKNITLTYRTAKEAGGLGVKTEFHYAGGQSAFHLGIFAPNHPTHANTRFPGFFMYSAYLEMPLQEGQRISFGWPWQGGGNRQGRVKRFEGQVAGWEEIQLPAGKLQAARIEGTLYYVDEGKVQAQARETFWYAPAMSQIVKIVRAGRVPDENLSYIVAELAEFR